MTTVELLSNRNFILFNKNIAHKLGIECAVLLGVFINKQQDVGDCEEFCYEENLIEEDTTLSTYAIRKAKDILKCNGILQIRKAGLPAKHWFKINNEKLYEFLRGDK